MKLASFWVWIIGLIIILSIIVINPAICFTQVVEGPSTGKQITKVSLKMFIVPEKEACRPNGYPPYGSDQKIHCSPLNMNDIKEWEDSDITIQTEKIPPKEISLGVYLLEILNNYTRFPISDYPAKRKSLVLVFEWDSPQNGIVSLERKACPSIPTRKWSNELRDHSHWIHHERADAFLPAYDVKWILKLNNNEWVFKTER